MQTYNLAEPVHFDGDDSLERFEIDFPKGDVTPKSEREEKVLEHLVTLGVATRKRKGKED